MEIFIVSLVSGVQGSGPLSLSQHILLSEIATGLSGMHTNEIARSLDCERLCYHAILYGSSDNLSTEYYNHVTKHNI